MSEKWWESGVRFQCQGSGGCCISRGEYGFVFMTDFDRKRMAEVLGVSTAEFTETYCDQTNGAYHLKEDLKRPECMFLKKNRCSVYEGRPTQCRTWPFWPEVMGAKAWKKEVVQFCPGAGKGELIPAERIRQQMKEQQKSEDQLIAQARRRQERATNLKSKS